MLYFPIEANTCATCPLHRDHAAGCHPGPPVGRRPHCPGLASGPVSARRQFGPRSTSCPSGPPPPRSPPVHPVPSCSPGFSSRPAPARAPVHPPSSVLPLHHPKTQPPHPYNPRQPSQHLQHPQHPPWHQHPWHHPSWPPYSRDTCPRPYQGLASIPLPKGLRSIVDGHVLILVH